MGRRQLADAHPTRLRRAGYWHLHACQLVGRLVGANGQKWARDAIHIATQAIYDANRAAVDAGRPTAATTAVLTAQLGAFADSIKKMVAPTLPQIPLLTPPEGFKRSVIDGESWSGEDVEEMLRLELDEEV